MIRRVAIYILLSGWPERDPSRLSVKLASRRGVPAFRLLGTIAWSVLFTFEPRSGRTPGGIQSVNDRVRFRRPQPNQSVWRWDSRPAAVLPRGRTPNHL